MAGSCLTRRNLVVATFSIITMAFVLNFRVMSSCDMIQTQWSIDCTDHTQNEGDTCVYLAKISMGFLAKQSLLADFDEGSNTTDMVKKCQWYYESDREWIWDDIWNITFITNGFCTVMGLVCMLIIGLATCIKYTKKVLRSLSMSMGALAILNMLPFLIFWKSDMCQSENMICNPSQSYCVGSCQIGMGGWQLFICSFMWISAMITTWSIPMPIETEEEVEDLKLSETSSSDSEDPTLPKQSREIIYKEQLEGTEENAGIVWHKPAYDTKITISYSGSSDEERHMESRVFKSN